MMKGGDYPSARSGTACATWKNRLLVYGGVQDDEGDNHRMQSVFYDDLFSFDTERKRWFKLGVKEEKKGGAEGGRRRRRKKDRGAGDANAGGENGDREEQDKEAADTGAHGAENDGGDYDGSDEEEDHDEDIDGNAESSGWDLDKVRSNMFAFIDGDGNVVYEKIERDANDNGDGDDNDDASDGEKKMAAKTTITETVVTDNNQEDTDDAMTKTAGCTGTKDPTTPGDENTTMGDDTTVRGTNATSRTDRDAKTTTSPTSPPPPSAALPLPTKSAVMAIAEGDRTPRALRPKTPLPRINSQIVVRGSTLYVYGGILEVGDREVTLDDCWSIDLQRRNGWTCVWPGTMHRQVWKGVEENDDDSYISTDRDGGGGGEGGESDDDEDEFEEFGEEELDEEAIAAAKAERRAERKAAKKEKVRGIREEIKSLNERLGLHSDGATPQMGEGLADFYARTAESWETHAAQTVAGQLEASSSSANGGGGGGGSMSSKELKRVGFSMAKLRFDELKPVLDRLQVLEGSQKEDEERKLKKGKKKDKKDKPKSRRK